MIFWLAIPLTLALYFATRALYRRLPWPIINPVLVPTAVIIGLLLPSLLTPPNLNQNLLIKNDAL